MSDFPCDHRGDVLRTVKCEACGMKDKDADVYACTLFGECTVHAANLRMGGKRTGAKMPVCLRCDSREVDGVKAEPLGAIEIQAVRRTVDRPAVPPCALQAAFAANVRMAREAAGVSLEAAAEAAGCGVSLWERIERGEHWPSPERLERIAGALGVSPAELLLTSAPV